MNTKGRSRKSRRKKPNPKNRNLVRVEHNPEKQPVEKRPRWLSVQPGRLMTLIGIAISAIIGLVAVWIAVSQQRSAEPSVTSNNLISFSNFTQYSPNSLAGVRGLAISGTLANPSPTPFILVQVEAQLDGTTYSVEYASKSNCAGGPLTLGAASLLPIELFVDDIPGSQMIKAGQEGHDLEFIAVDANGNKMTIHNSLPDKTTKDAYQDDLISLESECRGQFAGGS